MSRYIYYSTLDQDGEWSGWKRIWEAKGEVRPGYIPLPDIQDIVALGDKIYIFYRERDGYKAKALTQGPTGEFTEVIEIAEGVKYVRAVGVKTRFREEVLVLVRPFEQDADTNLYDALDAYRIEPGGQPESLEGKVYIKQGAKLTSMTVHASNSYQEDHPSIFFCFSSGARSIAIFGHPYEGIGESPSAGSFIVQGPPSKQISIGGSLYNYDLLSLGHTGVGLPGEDLLVLILNRSAASGWVDQIYLLDGNLNEIDSTNSTSGDVPTEIADEWFQAAGRFGDKIYLVAGGFLADFPWRDLRDDGRIDPERWYILGQISLGHESTERHLAVNLDALQTEEGRDAFRLTQKEHFDHFLYAGMAKKYLEELFLHAPLYLASLLNGEERYEHANDVYMAVFRPFTGSPSASFLYEGFCREDLSVGAGFDFREQVDYLRNPFDPHAIARVRPQSYARYTVSSFVDNLIDWSDAEFVRDTPESVAKARELYEAAADILELSGLPPELCKAGYSELLLKVLKTNSFNEVQKWTPFLNGIWKELARVGSKQVNTNTFSSLNKILERSEYGYLKRTQTVQLLKNLRGMDARPARKVQEVFTQAAKFVNNGFYWNAERRGLGAAIYPPDIQIWDPGYKVYEPSKFFEFGFCIPPNPYTDTLRFRIETNREKIRTCRNFAGVRRSLETYTAPVDPTSLVQAAAAGGGDIEDFIPAEPPSMYRYSFLIERARHLTTIAQHVESYLLSSLEKRDAAQYALLQAKSDLKLSRENVALQSLRVREASHSVQLATLQRDHVQFSMDHFQELIEEGLSDYEIAVLVLMGAAAVFQVGAAAAYFTAAALPSSVTGPAFTYSPQGSASAIGSGLSSVASALLTTSSIFSNLASYERREQEWRYQRDLAEWDVKFADMGIDIANGQLEITNKERGIASLSAELASDTIDFLYQKFGSIELYNWMKKELGKLYRRHLNMAISSARAAQQALAFELQEALNFIGYQYWEMKREGLLGAEKLLYDLERLEQHRLQRAERRREITKTISLAAMMPSEFQRFKQTSVLEFTTNDAWFDRDFPGHYMRLIKSVELSVLALVSPIDGIHAILTNHGFSRVMVGPPFVEPTVLQRPAESVALSSPQQASGVFQLRLDDPMLLPFEGSGVETSWTLEISKGANRFDFNTLIDTLVTIRYTAKEDWGYRQKVLAQLEESYQSLAYFSVKNSFPDMWYHFHNPVFLHDPAQYGFEPGKQAPPYTLRFKLERAYFPPNELDIKIAKTMVATNQKDAFKVPVRVEFIPEGSAVSIAADNLEIVDGVLSLPHFNGRPPFGTWTIVLRTDAPTGDYPEFFEGLEDVNGQKKVITDWLQDLLLVINYSARIEYARL